MTFSELKKIMTKIDCIQKYNVNEGNNFSKLKIPSAYLLLTDERFPLVTIGGDKVVQVIWFANVVINPENEGMISEFVNRMERTKLSSNIVVVLNKPLLLQGVEIKMDKKERTKLEHKMKDDWNLIQKWEKLQNSNFDVRNAQFDIRLRSLAENIGVLFLSNSDTFGVNNEITRLIRDEIERINTMQDTVSAISQLQYQKRSKLSSLPLIKNADDESESEEDDFALPDLGSGINLLRYTESGNNNPELPQEEVVERDMILDNLMLAKLTDPLSVFVRDAVGSIGMEMLEAFIVMPEIHKSITEDNCWRYFLSMTSTMQAAIRKTEEWLLNLSRGKLFLGDVIRMGHPFQNRRNYSLFQVCANLVGQFVIQAKSQNPNRGLGTRFTIPIQKLNLNDCLLELRLLLRIQDK